MIYLCCVKEWSWSIKKILRLKKSFDMKKEMKKILAFVFALALLGQMPGYLSGANEYLVRLLEIDFKPSSLISSQETMTANFELKNILEEPMFLFLKGRVGNAESCSVKVSLNGKTVARGDVDFPSDFFGISRYPIPKGHLKPGSNQISILNKEARGFKPSPWFMIAECCIASSRFAPSYDLMTEFSFPLPRKVRPSPGSHPKGKSLPAFAVRGTKGWAWYPEQYLAEIPYIRKFKMNFLMNCYASMFSDPEKFINRWWEPIPEPKKRAYEQVVRACQRSGIIFCFSFHPQLFSERPFAYESEDDFRNLWQHYDWMQGLGVRWFMVSYDDIPIEGQDMAYLAKAQAGLVNRLLSKLREKDAGAQMVFCPVFYAGCGDSGEARVYLEALAGALAQDVSVFWTGDGVVTTSISRQCAERYKSIVKRRLIIWDNYPVNDRNPALHLGPVTGRDPDLCEIAYGYMSNPLSPQNDINRIPLFTSADYAFNPWTYDPFRSIGQAVIHLARTKAQKKALKDLIELYPGNLIYGQPRTNFNSVLERFERILQEPNAQTSAASFIRRTEDVASRLDKEFPGQYQKTLETICLHIGQMKEKYNEKFGIQ